MAKLTINELQNWWKSKLESLDLEENTVNVFYLTLNSNDLKKNLFIEQKIKNILKDDEFFLNEFSENIIKYKIISRYSIDHINLALEPSNIKLIKKSPDSNDFTVESY